MTKFKTEQKKRSEKRYLICFIAKFEKKRIEYMFHAKKLSYTFNLFSFPWPQSCP